MELLARLLSTYERSVSYGRPAPWPRDVIVKVDARTFPDAFAPEGREHRASLVTAAHELEAEGCGRVVHHARGPLSGEPKEIRLGPEQVSRAYEVALGLGYEPLAVGLAALERHATRLSMETAQPWMRAFLEALATGARVADLSAIGMKRERFKREWREVVQALLAAKVLADGIQPAWERVVSERIFKDSKLLARVRALVVAILVRADPRWDGVPPEEAADLLEAYGVRRKPGLIRCAGAATLRVGSGVYRLEDFTPAAHLPDGWADAWVDAIIEADVRVITTVENEYPFLSYIEEAGGPAFLGARAEVVLFTAGFPTPALTNTLARLAERAPDIRFRHWGDADVGGIRIWWLLRTRLGRPVELLRTTADWVAAEAPRGGKPLATLERSALARLRAELQAVNGADVIAVCELIDALLTHGTKLEQERF
jgi:hypothetical protein